jgi:hypothetical protein
MKTHDLINALAADRAANSPRPGYAVALAVGIGVIISATLLVLSIGIRPDLASAALSPRFVTKAALALLFAAGAIAVVTCFYRPDTAFPRATWILIAVPLLLAIAVAAELLFVAQAQWKTRLFGAHWLACLVLIPLFALPPLAGLLIALRGGAPRNGSVAGAAAGFAAGGIAAAIYVAHCPDDSPLFVAAWYTLAICSVALLGSLAGSRWLRW